MVIAPDAPERMIKISSDDAVLELYDGRMLAQNGWFVLRSVLPAGKTGKVVTWTVEPNSVQGWIREPNIGFSQVGYIPSQPKTAVIELDKNDKPLSKASIYRIDDDGNETVQQLVAIDQSFIPTVTQFAATLINGHEYGFDSGSRLGHYRSSASGSNG